ncbi:MAG: hypothetical protein E6G67_05335, partial [Actinobacteria bacterium]
MEPRRLRQVLGNDRRLHRRRLERQPDRCLRRRPGFEHESTNSANTELVTFGGKTGVVAYAQSNAPAGTTYENSASGTGGSAGSRATSAVFDEPRAATGNTGSRTITDSTNNPWVGQLVALKLDNTPPNTPTLSITEASTDSYQSGTNFFYRPAGTASTFTVTAGGTGDSQSGMQKVNFPGLGNGITPTTGTDDLTSPYSQVYNWANGASYSNASNTVTAYDNANGTATATFSVVPDSAAPSTTDDTGSIGSAWKNTNQTVTLTPGDGTGSGVAATYYTTDGSTPTTSSSQGTSIVLSANGTYSIKYFSVDNVNNSEPVQTAGTQIRIDKTAPTSATLNALPSYIKNGQALTGTGVDGGPSGIASIAYYECAGGACAPNVLIGSSSTGPSYSVTWSSQPADGTFQVLARVSDGAGNTLDSPKQTVTIDNTSPSAPAITASPANPTTSTSASFSFTGEASATFQCQLDSGGYSACTSPKSYSGLADGSHT